MRGDLYHGPFVHTSFAERRPVTLEYDAGRQLDQLDVLRHPSHRDLIGFFLRASSNPSLK